MSAIICVRSYGFGTNASTIPTCLIGAFPDVRMTGMSGYLSRSGGQHGNRNNAANSEL